jgi:hypothetical protein
MIHCKYPRVQYLDKISILNNCISVAKTQKFYSVGCVECRETAIFLKLQNNSKYREITKRRQHKCYVLRKFPNLLHYKTLNDVTANEQEENMERIVNKTYYAQVQSHICGP